MTRPEVSRKIAPEEVQAQDKTKPWVRMRIPPKFVRASWIVSQFVVNGEVYDASSYLGEHPGGPDSIFLVAGEDATEDFMAIHSSDAKKKLAEVMALLLVHFISLLKHLPTVPHWHIVE
jgi:nitrate reductase (NAD(P)H)